MKRFCTTIIKNSFAVIPERSSRFFTLVIQTHL